MIKVFYGLAFEGKLLRRSFNEPIGEVGSCLWRKSQAISEVVQGPGQARCLSKLPNLAVAVHRHVGEHSFPSCQALSFCRKFIFRHVEQKAFSSPFICRLLLFFLAQDNEAVSLPTDLHFRRRSNGPESQISDGALCKFASKRVRVLRRNFSTSLGKHSALPCNRNTVFLFSFYLRF